MARIVKGKTHTYVVHPMKHRTRKGPDVVLERYRAKQAARQAEEKRLQEKYPMATNREIQKAMGRAKHRPDLAKTADEAMDQILNDYRQRFEELQNNVDIWTDKSAQADTSYDAKIIEDAGNAIADVLRFGVARLGPIMAWYRLTQLLSGVDINENIRKMIYEEYPGSTETLKSNMSFAEWKQHYEDLKQALNVSTELPTPDWVIEKGNASIGRLEDLILDSASWPEFNW